MYSSWVILCRLAGLLGVRFQGKCVSTGLGSGLWADWRKAPDLEELSAPLARALSPPLPRRPRQVKGAVHWVVITVERVANDRHIQVRATKRVAHDDVVEHRALVVLHAGVRRRYIAGQRVVENAQSEAFTDTEQLLAVG